MKANIRNKMGLDLVEILKEPFVIKGIKLFVYFREYSGEFVITEWQTGMSFAKTETEENIKPAIVEIFKKVPIERMQKVIADMLEKHGVANKEGE